MATILETVHNEFESVFPSILLNEYSDLIAEDFVNSPNSLLLEELNLLKGAPRVNEDEWETLYDFLVLVDQCESSEGEIDIEKEFGRFIEKYPDTILFQYLRIHYTTSSIITGNYKGDIAMFYKDVFENHPEFLNNTISDFFERSNLLESILLLENPSIALINLIQDSAKRYSTSNLKFTLAQLFFLKQDYQNALLVFYHFAGQVETESPLDNYTKEQYHISISNIANICFYHIKDYENASLYVDVCLSEYEKNDDVYAFQFLFLDPLLIRLRLSMFKKDKEGFEQNYELLRSKADDSDFAELEIDDIKKFANELKM